MTIAGASIWFISATTAMWDGSTQKRAVERKELIVRISIVRLSISLPAK
jgi:hypothetical protein